MTAAFGTLQNRTLELEDGLNILQAPNESGKSTWCAFLLAMLYGINSRERDRAGFIAEKNRYAPWSGAAMSGRMDCRALDAELTLSRTTRRQSAPMGEFRAVYAGTGEPVPELTGPACGETLLGVSREVYERSAFIRQAGMAVTQDAGLERRIAALITSGEEDTSYSEAAEALKRQRNRRRHNKTGQLPALEGELAELRRQIAEAEELEARLLAARSRTEELEERETALRAELALHDRWEASQRRKALAEAEFSAIQTEHLAQDLRRRLEEDRIPENDTIGRLRGAIVNLETTRKGVDRARQQRDEAAQALLRAEAAVGASPFAGQSAESARREAAEPPKSVPWNPLPGIAVILCGVPAAFLAFYGILQASHSAPLSLAALAALLCLVFVLAFSLRKRALTAAQRAALLKRFGTDDGGAITALAEDYCALLSARDTAQAEANARSAAAESLYAALSANEQGILLEVRRFAPTAFDIPTADALLRTCAQRRRELMSAEAAARDARSRSEALASQTADAPQGEEPLSPPARSREETTRLLASAQAERTAARSEADRLSGRLHAIGETAALRSDAERLQQEIAALEGEYDAIQLAMEALDRANAALQSRFSPELGRRAAEIFSRLTDGRYDGVVLDRAFHLSAEPAGEGIYRDAALLSAGAADQLYLAVRLAICELVLPAEQAAPIVLDDALANFDDERCAAALRYLKELGRQRQILLFTCHSREAAFFAGDGEVSVRRLTERG